MMKRVFTLGLVLLLLLSVAFTAQAATSQQKMKSALMKIDYYLTSYENEELRGYASLDDVAQLLKELGEFPHADEMYEYCYVLICLESEDYIAAKSMCEKLVKNTSISEFIVTDDFAEQYPGIADCSVLSDYVNGRICENNSDAVCAIALFRKCGAFCDSMSRATAFIDENALSIYDRARELFMLKGYEQALPMFEQLEAYEYMDSADYAQQCRDMLAPENDLCETEVETEARPIMLEVVKQCRVRKGPGVEYDRLGYMDVGTQVQLLGENGDWYKVSFDDGEGYISKTCASVID